MQDGFIKNNDGITYALLHITIGLIALGAIWIIAGVIIDELNLLSDSLVIQSEIWGDKTQDGLTELNKIWQVVLWVVVGASFLYGIITAIRKNSSGLDG